MASAKARAQADEALEQCVVVMKRQQAVLRRTIQSARQAQATLKGIEMDVTPQSGDTDGYQDGP